MVARSSSSRRLRLGSSPCSQASCTAPRLSHRASRTCTRAGRQPLPHRAPSTTDLQLTAQLTGKAGHTALAGPSEERTQPVPCTFKRKVQATQALVLPKCPPLPHREALKSSSPVKGAQVTLWLARNWHGGGNVAKCPLGNGKQKMKTASRHS